MAKQDKAGGLWSEVFTVPPELVERLFGKESMQAPTEMANIAAVYQTAIQSMINESIRRQRALQLQASEADRQANRLMAEAMNNIAELDAKMQQLNLQRDMIAWQGLSTLFSQVAQNWDKWFKPKKKENDQKPQTNQTNETNETNKPDEKASSISIPNFEAPKKKPSKGTNRVDFRGAVKDIIGF